MKIPALNNLFVKFFNSINDTVLSIVHDKNLSYGLSIIFLTIIIRLCLLPLNVKQIKSSIGMSKIAPLTKKLQAKYKNDPKKLNEETMKLYKENNVNPFGGCLPLLLQWPILLALYYVFSTLNIKGVGFLWIHDLSEKAVRTDWTTWILPVVSGATTYFSGMLMSFNGDKEQAKQTQTMNIMMSVMLFWMSLNFNAALVLYWVTGNIVQMLQTQLVMKIVKKSDENKEEIKNSEIEEKDIKENVKLEKTTRKNRRKREIDGSVEKNESSNSEV